MEEGVGEWKEWFCLDDHHSSKDTLWEDHTNMTLFERFVAQVEIIVRKWRSPRTTTTTTQKEREETITSLESFTTTTTKTQFKGNYIIYESSVLYDDFECNLSLYLLKSQLSQRNSHANSSQPSLASYLFQSGQQMLKAMVLNARNEKHLFRFLPPIAPFIVLSPDRQSLLSKATLRFLLSGLGLALDNADCHMAAFVVNDSAECSYLEGLFNSLQGELHWYLHLKEDLTEPCTTISCSSKSIPTSTYFSSLLSLFYRPKGNITSHRFTPLPACNYTYKSNRASPLDVDADYNILISSLTKFIDGEERETAWKSELLGYLKDENNQEALFEVDIKCFFPIVGGTEDLDPWTATEFCISIEQSQSFRCRFAETLQTLTLTLEAILTETPETSTLSKSKRMCKKSLLVDYLPAPPNPSIIAPQTFLFQTLLHDAHPTDSLLDRLIHVDWISEKTYSELKVESPILLRLFRYMLFLWVRSGQPRALTPLEALQTMAVVWSDFIGWVETRWRRLEPLDDPVLTQPVNYKTPLIVQKLALLNKCILLEKQRGCKERKYNDFSGLFASSPLFPNKETNNAWIENKAIILRDSLYSFITNPSSISFSLSQPPVNVEDLSPVVTKELEQEDEFFDTESFLDTGDESPNPNPLYINTESKTQACQMSNAFLLAHPKVPLFIPETQEIPLLPHDMIMDHLEFSIGFKERALPSSSDPSSKWLKSSLKSNDRLISDIQAFKAANPLASFVDFIRWYSPKDWLTDTDNEGSLSQRMMEPDNDWVTLWSAISPLPASEQTPLFNAAVEAEKILFHLHHLSVFEFISQFLPSFYPLVATLLFHATLSEAPVPFLTNKVVAFGNMIKIFPWFHLIEASPMDFSDLILALTSVEESFLTWLAIKDQFPDINNDDLGLVLQYDHVNVAPSNPLLRRIKTLITFGDGNSFVYSRLNNQRRYEHRSSDLMDTGSSSSEGGGGDSYEQLVEEHVTFQCTKPKHNYHLEIQTCPYRN